MRRMQKKIPPASSVSVAVAGSGTTLTVTGLTSQGTVFANTFWKLIP